MQTERLKMKLSLKPKGSHDIALRTCRKGTYVYPSRYSGIDMSNIASTFSANGLSVKFRKTTLFVS